MGALGLTPSVSVAEDRLVSWGGGQYLAADPRRPRGASSGRARCGLDRGFQPALPNPLSPSVELGFGVHGARPLVVRPVACPEGARDALPRAVVERDGAPHRLQ